MYFEFEFELITGQAAIADLFRGTATVNITWLKHIYVAICINLVYTLLAF